MTLPIRATYHLYPAKVKHALPADFEITGNLAECQKTLEQILAAGYSLTPPDVDDAEPLKEGEELDQADLYLIHQQGNGSKAIWLYDSRPHMKMRVAIAYEEDWHLLPFIPDLGGKAHTITATDKATNQELSFLKPTSRFEFVRELRPAKKDNGMPSKPFARTTRVFDDYGNEITWLTAAEQRKLMAEAAQQRSEPPPPPPATQPEPPPPATVTQTTTDQWDDPGDPDADEHGFPNPTPLPPPQPKKPAARVAKENKLDELLKQHFAGEAPKVLAYMTGLYATRNSLGTIQVMPDAGLDWAIKALTESADKVKTAWEATKANVTK